MAEPTVFEMEIEGVVHPVEDRTARAGVLVPTLNTGEEITALKDSENVSHGLADTVARQGLEKLQGYSTTEQDTGKTWFDGSKIYRRVVVINSPAEFAAGEFRSYDINPVIGNLRQVVSAQISALGSAGVTYTNLLTVWSVGSYFVNFYSNTAGGFYNIAVTIEYVKTA